MNYCEMSKKIDVKFGSSNSIKTNELNHILDKISIRRELSPREKEFLDNFITSISSNEDIIILYISIFKFIYIEEYIRLLVAGCWFVLESP